MSVPSPTALHSPQARRLVHLASLPSVVMHEKDRDALLAGAAALEREWRKRSDATVRAR